MNHVITPEGKLPKLPQILQLRKSEEKKKLTSILHLPNEKKRQWLDILWAKADDTLFLLQSAMW